MTERTNAGGQSGGFFRELGVNFFSYGMVSAFSNFISFLMVPFFTRVFSTVEYGVLETIQMVVMIIALFGTLMLENSFLRFFFDSDDVSFQRQVFSSGFYALIPASLFVTALLTIFPVSSSQLLFRSPDYALVVFFGVLRIPFKNMMAYCSATFLVEFNRKRYAQFHISFIIVNVTASILAAVVFRLGLTGLLAAQSAVAVLFAAIAVYFARRYLSGGPTWGMMRKMLGYSLPMIPASLSSYGQRYVNRVFVLVLYSMYSMGIFSVASKIAMPLMLMAASLRMAWVPYAFKTWQMPGSPRNFRLFLDLYIGVAGLLSVGFAYLGPELVHIISTKEYSDASVLIGFLALAFGTQSASRLIGVGLSIKKRTGLLSLATMFGIFTASVAMVLLSGHLKLLGIAIGTLVGELTGFTVLAILVRRTLPGYFSYKITAMVFAITGIFLIANLFLTDSYLILRLAIIGAYAAILCLVYIIFVSPKIFKQAWQFATDLMPRKRRA
jgi:O-antigen/teichoic acid export membrane protein